MKPRRLTLPLALFMSLSGPSCNRPAKDDASTTKAEPSAKDTAASQTANQDPNQIPAPADVAAPPANAQKTESGLASVVLQPGSGDKKPTEFDKVKVNYTGWTKDGKMFDSTEKRKTPATFAVKGVIKGWTEGLQLMTVGEKRRFWIPGNLAYGDTPKRPGAPAGQLTFDVELLEVIEGPKPPPVPEDVAAAPADATKTKSGLAYKVLEKGTGNTHPTEKQRVQVHYTGWTTDGKMFDSSVVRGRPATFGLNGVIKGWTEGVQLMVEGEKTRFWIPGDLAYGETPKRPGAPAGTLVFDIELIKIVGGKAASPQGAAASKSKTATKSPPKAATPKPATPKANTTAPKTPKPAPSQ